VPHKTRSRGSSITPRSIFFWRSHGGIEVDLIIHAQGKLWPIEVKLTPTPSVQHAKGLNRFKQLAGKETSEQGIIVCGIKKRTDLPGNNIALPWTSFYDWLEMIIKGEA
jgi:hypothetical protein